MKASRKQIQELANVISLQADALAKTDAGSTDRWLAAKAALILSNAQTLVAWTKIEEGET